MPARRSPFAALIALLAAVPAAAAPALPPAPAASPGGVWLNPHRSVAVRTGRCGTGQLCGWIVWASAEAQADARDAGVARLIGTALLQDYRPDGEGRWKGTVFVPDRGRGFLSEIALLSPGELQVKGCILGGLLCKSQVWTRIAEPPRG